MKILVTGGAGFIGSNLINYLYQKSNDYQITVIDNLSTGIKENIEPYLSKPNFRFVQGSVCDAHVMDELIQWCDYCFHFAAPVGVKLVMEHPVRTILDNIRGIDIILELITKYKKRVLVASTSEIYGKSLDLLDPTNARKLAESDYRVEGSTRNHRWAYANTKAMDEFLAFAYHKEFGTEVIIARFFNTVGPQQLSNFGMVIPNFVKNALAGKDLVVFGSGEQRRSFLHVEDAVRAIYELMFTGVGVGEEFNVGNPFEITINELAQKIIAKTGNKVKLHHIPYEAAYGKGFEDMDRRTADITKLKKFIDFDIEHDLDSILDTVIAFHRQKIAQS